MHQLFNSFLIICLLIETSYASNAEIDLNGFRLQQFTLTAESVYGEHFQTVDLGDVSGKAYGVDKNSYMIIYERKQYPKYIDALQLTGTSSNAMPFKGLSLGDPKSKVIDTIGLPAKIKETEISGLNIYYYDDKNYSVEIDKNNRLYSIRIFTTSAIVSEIKDSENTWEKFKNAVNSKSINILLEVCRPDVEIYQGEETHTIRTRFSDFAASPDPRFVKAFFDGGNSVRSVINSTEPSDEATRLIENFGIGLVYKFPKDSILHEIVFFPYNGEYRLYEVAFRKENEI